MCQLQRADERLQDRFLDGLHQTQLEQSRNHLVWRGRRAEQGQQGIEGREAGQHAQQAPVVRGKGYRWGYEFLLPDDRAPIDRVKKRRWQGVLLV